MKINLIFAIFIQIFIGSHAYAQDWITVSGLFKIDLQSVRASGTRVSVDVDQGQGSEVALVDCPGRKVQFEGQKSVYVPNGSTAGFVLSFACSQQEPTVFPKDHLPEFCNTQNIGWMKLVCDNEVLRVADRESNFLYEKVLSQCKNKVDVLKYKKAWFTSVYTCRSSSCVNKEYSRRDNDFSTLLNSFPESRMCSIAGVPPSVTIAFLANSNELPSDHAYNNYMACAFRAAEQLDDQISGADVIGSAVLSNCLDAAKLWAFANTESMKISRSEADFFENMRSSGLNANIVLAARKAKNDLKNHAQEVQKNKHKKTKPQT